MIVTGNTIKLVDVGTSSAVVPDSQSPIAKAVRNIKKKNADAFIRVQPTSSRTEKANAQRESADRASGRGVVYLSHIPDGFYEDEIRQYFSQFGRVSRVKLSRSKKTAKSRGYAFIEFQYAEVAKVVAETMNNYLLYNRLLKARYMDKDYPAAFWNRATANPQYTPLAKNRRAEVKLKNAVLAPAKELAQQGKRRRQLAKTLNRLKDAGVDFTVQVKDQVQLPAVPEKNEKQLKGKKNTNQEKQKAEKADEVYEQVQPVLLVDESDDEIEFNVPSYVVRKSLKRQSCSPSPERTPKSKKGKKMKNEASTSKSATPQENGSSEKKQNAEAITGSPLKTRKSGRTSIIPKHISSSFHVTIGPKRRKSQGKDNNDNQSSGKVAESVKYTSTPKRVSTPSPKLQNSTGKSTETFSYRKKSPTNEQLLTPKNVEMVSSKLHKSSRKTPQTPENIKIDSFHRKSLKASKSITKTPPVGEVTPSSGKGKKVKSVENKENREMKTPKTPGSGRINSPKSKERKSVANISPKQFSLLQKTNSVDKKSRVQRSQLETPKSRKSQLKSPGGLLRVSPHSPSPAVNKRFSRSPKMVKSARKSLKSNN